MCRVQTYMQVKTQYIKNKSGMKIKACPQVGHYHNRHYRKKMLTQTSNKGKLQREGAAAPLHASYKCGGALAASALCTMPSDWWFSWVISFNSKLGI